MSFMVSKLGNAWKAIQRNQQRRADYWLVVNMTDRELKDLGITRSEIWRRVYEGVK